MYYSWTPMKRLSLFLLDITALYGGLVITLFVRYPDNFRYNYDIHLVPFLFIFSLGLMIFYITNLYDTNTLRNNIYFYSNLFRSISAASVISIAFFYLIPYFKIAPRTNLFIFILISTGLLTLFRTLFNNVSEKGFKKPLLIVGVNPQSLELAEFIEKNPQIGYDLKYVLDLAKEGVRNIDEIIKKERINTIVITPETYQVPEIINVFYKTLENRVTFRNLSSFYEQVTNRVPLGAINQIWFLENLSEGSKKTYEELKRFSDLIFAFVLGVVVAPFIPLITGLVKLTSEGAVFYRQKRVGQNGKIFEIVKFRTMRSDAEKDTGAIWTVENDPRITRVGRFLRKTRLDELPQIWNILKGEMSFVGPRAERPEFHDMLQKNVPFYEERYLIKPGLTGWAQINFHYGSSVGDAAEKLKYDLYYIKNRSLLFDLGIVLKTIRIAFQQEGR